MTNVRAERGIRMKTMPSLSTSGAFTRADFDRLPEGFPAQLVNGWLVKDAARTYGHQGVAFRLCRQLCEIVGEARVFLAPIDVPIDDRNVYQPDVIVHRQAVSWARRHAAIPLLAIEVLSPTTARRDRARKTPRLLKAGVEEVWLVDPETGTVEVVDHDGRRVSSGDEPIASRAVPGFSVIPRVLFTPP